MSSSANAHFYFSFDNVSYIGELLNCRNTEKKNYTLYKSITFEIYFLPKSKLYMVGIKNLKIPMQYQ